MQVGTYDVMRKERGRRGKDASGSAHSAVPITRVPGMRRRQRMLLFDRTATGKGPPCPSLSVSSHQPLGATFLGVGQNVVQRRHSCKFDSLSPRATLLLLLGYSIVNTHTPSCELVMSCCTATAQPTLRDSSGSWTLCLENFQYIFTSLRNKRAWWANHFRFWMKSSPFPKPAGSPT